MKRALLIVLLSFGTVAGYASGIYRLTHGCGYGDRFGHRPQSWSCPCHPAAPPAQATPPQQPQAPETPPAP